MLVEFKYFINAVSHNAVVPPSQYFSDCCLNLLSRPIYCVINNNINNNLLFNTLLVKTYNGDNNIKIWCKMDISRSKIC